MNVGVVFASSGGLKLERAIRSLRVTEPDIPIYVVIDSSTKTYQSNIDNNSTWEWFSKNNVSVRCVYNKAYINGILNECISWMWQLGKKYACVFHDDVIFSPLKSMQGHVSLWFNRLEHDPDLIKSSGLSFGCMQAFVSKTWRRHPKEWDAMDLESKDLWEKLLGHHNVEDWGYEEQFPDFFVQYYATSVLRNCKRLGPTGFIIPTETWKYVRFDESLGIFYDDYYPAECYIKGLPPVKLIPNIPHLHLHNQTIGFEDPASGIWTNTSGAFEKKFGKTPELFWEGRL